MTTTTLKTTIHQLVEEIENEQLLQTLRDFLAVRKDAKPGKMWEELSEEQKQETLLALEESEDESTLISRDEFLKRNK